jgi:hypothetical protein
MAKGCGKPVGNIGPAVCLRKRANRATPRLRCAKPVIPWGFKSGSVIRFLAHASLHMTVKNDSADSLAHRQIH